MSVFAKPGQMNHNIQFRHCLYSVDPQGLIAHVNSSIRTFSIVERAL
ncbi:hypothetical protein OROMI_025076 [Orobanche minor]